MSVFCFQRICYFIVIKTKRGDDMSSIKLMKTAKTGYIVMSVLFCLLGIMLIAIPEFSVSVLAAVFGIMLILFGIFKIIGYFSRDLFRLAFQYDLALGLLLIVLGIITILKTDNVMAFISIVLGIYVLADSLLKIQIALDAKVFGIRKWWAILVSAIAAGIIGCLLIIRPYEGADILVILSGFSLLLEGILNLVTVLTAVKIIRKKAPERADEVIIDIS